MLKEEKNEKLINFAQNNNYFIKRFYFYIFFLFNYKLNVLFCAKIGNLFIFSVLHY